MTFRRGTESEKKKGGGSSDLREEVVSQNVIQVGSVLRGLGEQAGDQLLCLWRQGRGHGVARLSDASVRLLQVGGFKRRPAQQHGVPERWGKDQRSQSFPAQYGRVLYSTQ